MKDSTTSIGVDLSEVALDSITDDGILKDVPIVGTMVNVAKTVGSVKDRILLNKVRAFLEGSASITDDEREKFASKLENDSKFSARVQEQLAILLDRFDSISKAEILGYLFTGLVKELLPADIFLRLSHRVDTSFVDDLPQLEDFYGQTDGYVCKPPYPVLPGLVDPVPNMGGEDGIQLFAITLEGKRLVEIIRHHRKNAETE